MSTLTRVTGRVLRSQTLAALTSPHGVDRYLELVNPMWAAHDVRARLVDRRAETADVATLTLRPTATWAGHRAGQHVRLGLDTGDGRRLTRAFSVSSAASGPGEDIALTVRADPDGEVSRRLVAAEVGTVVHLGQATGDFTLPDPLPSRIALVSGGSGITPVMSLLRTLRQRRYDGRVLFLHYARTCADQIYADELAALRDGPGDEPGIDVHLVRTREGGDRFTADALAALLPGFRDVDTWACGPAGLVEAVEAAYAGSDRLRTELFKVPATRLAGTAGGTLTFTRSGRSVPNDGRPALLQAEDAGLTPESGCRMGICVSCTARKSEGTVRNVVTGATSSLPDEEIQVCVSAPEGDCAIDL